MLEHAAFESPLSDEHLRELGRLVINCGFVGSLLNFHVAKQFIRDIPMQSAHSLENLDWIRERKANCYI